MTQHWISFDQVFDGRDIHTQAALRVEDRRIAEISTGSIPDCEQHIGGLVSPGYVDLQVNGGGGVLLNTNPTREGIAAIAAAHRSFGTVAVMPTVITDHPDVLVQAANAAIEAHSQSGIIGLHIEGPHIAASRRGTHKAEYIRPMDMQTLEVVRQLRQSNVPVMLTLAPEAVTLDQITQLADMQVVVSIGHTDASAELVTAAIGAGASCATHLYNAMSPMAGRAAGAVGAIINSNVYSGIICDGHHVADEMVGLAIRARPQQDRMFLVSDAMATVGGPESFKLYGQQIQLDGGRLINAEGSLAGAHVTQAQAVKRLVEFTGTSLVTALRMATSVPAGCVGLPELGQLQGRALDDVVVLGSDLEVSGSVAGLYKAR